MTEDIRWKQRFESFEKAWGYFKDSMESDFQNFSVREKMGVIQEFELLLELSWKLIKDYLEHEGTKLLSKSPRSVLAKGLEAKIIRDEAGWNQMLEDRNVFSHAYAPAHFAAALENFQSRHYGLFKELYEFFQSRR